MRAIVAILVIAILVFIAGLATGFIDINQIRGARVPQVGATHNGVIAKGGQAPAFDVETGSVSVGSKPATVQVPALQVQKPANQVANSTANGM